MTASHAVACVNGVGSLLAVSIWNAVTALPTITACAHSWRIARQASASATAMVVKRARDCACPCRRCVSSRMKTKVPTLSAPHRATRRPACRGQKTLITKSCQDVPLLAVGRNGILVRLGDRFPQPNRYLPSQSPAACGGDLYFDAGRNQPVRRGPTGCELVERTMECREVKRVIEASVGECRDCAADGDRGVRRGAQRPHRLVVQLRHHAQLDGCGLHVPCADAQ